jgi:hypothetical protein
VDLAQGGPVREAAYLRAYKGLKQWQPSREELPKAGGGLIRRTHT